MSASISCALVKSSFRLVRKDSNVGRLEDAFSDEIEGGVTIERNMRSSKKRYQVARGNRGSGTEGKVVREDRE